MINNYIRPKNEVAAWLKKFDARCQTQGIRLTAQRRAAFAVLAESLYHPSVEMIHSRLKHSFPNLPMPTVYRIMEDLLKAGLIRRVANDEGPVRFDANIEAHQHLVCRLCGAIEDCAVPALAKLPLPKKMANNFAVEQYDIRLVGTCRRCSGRKAG